MGKSRVQYGPNKNLLILLGIWKTAESQTTRLWTNRKSKMWTASEDTSGRTKSRKWTRRITDLNSWPEYITSPSVQWRTATQGSVLSTKENYTVVIVRNDVKGWERTHHPSFSTVTHCNPGFSSQHKGQLYRRHSQKRCEGLGMDIRAFSPATKNRRLQRAGVTYEIFGVLWAMIWLLPSRMRQGVVWNKFTSTSETSAASTLKLDITDPFLKHRQISTRLHGVTFQKTAISFISSSRIWLNFLLRHVLSLHLHCTWQPLETGRFGSALCADKQNKSQLSKPINRCIHFDADAYIYWGPTGVI
jgi:hypothetical protein